MGSIDENTGIRLRLRDNRDDNDKAQLRRGVCTIGRSELLVHFYHFIFSLDLLR